MSKIKDYDKLQDSLLRMTPDAFRQVIESGNLDPNSFDNYGGSVLSFGIREFRFDHARILLELGATPDMASLNIAISGYRMPVPYNTDEILRLMLDKYNTDVNITDIHGNTVLIDAIRAYVNDTNFLEVVDLIFKHGGNLAIKNNANNTMFAEIFKLFDNYNYDKIVDVFKLLLPYAHSQKVDINEVIDSGNIIVEVLAKHGIKEEVRQQLFEELISLESENGQPLFNIDAGIIRNIFYNNAEAIDHYINILARRGYELGNKTVDHKTSTVISISGFDHLPGKKITAKYSDVSHYLAGDDTFEIEVEDGFKNVNNQIFNLFGRNNNIKFLSLGDGQTDLYNQDIEKFLKKSIAPVKINNSNSTLLLLHFHGSVTIDQASGQKTHLICLNKHNQKIKTEDLFKQINAFFQKPVDIILTSCKSGTTKDLVHLLPNGSKLIQFCSDEEDVPTTSYLEKTITSFINSGISPEDITILDIIKAKFLSSNDSSGCNFSSRGTKLPILSISGREITDFETFCQDKITLEIKDGVIVNCKKIDKELMQLFVQYWYEVLPKENMQNFLLESDSLVIQNGSQALIEFCQCENDQHSDTCPPIGHVADWECIIS